MELTKTKQADLPKIKRELIAKQNGLCPICKQNITSVASKNIVIDHDHKTGIIRAALHRGCNGTEGKVYRVVQMWGKASTLSGVIKVLENLIAFWKLHRTPQTNYIYYSHKTPAEKRLAVNKKRRIAAKRKREK